MVASTGASGNHALVFAILPAPQKREKDKILKMKISDKQKVYNLERKLEKCKQMISVLQRSTCTATAATREKLVAAEILKYEFPVHVICEALLMPRGTFYNHLFRNKKDDAWFLQRDRVLSKLVLDTFNDHEQRIGSDKIAAVIRKSGIDVSAEKVSELMQELGISSIRTSSKKLYKKQREKAKNLIQQNFTASAPNQVWLSDVTEFRFKLRTYYICVIEDIFSRCVIAYKVSHRNSTHLILMTLREAIRTRGVPKTLICHTDNGRPYESRAVQKFLQENGICASFSRPRTPYDNSPIESFNKTLKVEELYRRIYSSVRDFLASLSKFVQYYNKKRPHQTLKYSTPAEFEEQYFTKLKQ